MSAQDPVNGEVNGTVNGGSLTAGRNELAAGASQASLDAPPVDTAVVAAEDANCGQMWTLAACTLNRARAALHDGDPSRRAYVLREASGTLVGLSLALEGADEPGELARSAKLLAGEAEEAERQAAHRTKRLQRRVLYGLAAAISAPKRRESDFTRIVKPLTNLMYAHHLRHKAQRDAQRAYVPARSHQLKKGRQR